MGARVSHWQAGDRHAYLRFSFLNCQLSRLDASDYQSRAKLTPDIGQAPRVFRVSEQACPLSRDDIYHLLRRTGFGPTPQEADEFDGLSREQAVDRLLSGVSCRTEATLPRWARLPKPTYMAERHKERHALAELEPTASREYRKKLSAERRAQGSELKAWWMAQMLATSQPLTERLVLFWSNHFTSSLRKVRNPRHMWEQQQLLRREAVGSFARLLHGITLDPAMLIYLDNARNRASQPNENYARELLELYSLGEGHYTEADVRAAARALTGYRVTAKTGEVTFVARQHDASEKLFLGESAAFDAQSLVDHILQQPRCAEFVCRKLWLEFVGEPVDAQAIRHLAAELRRTDYEIEPVLRSLFLDDAFWEAGRRGTRIKSPVELLVGTARLFGLRNVSPTMLVNHCRRLGQDLFDPPDVAGWPRGKAWLNSTTLMDRWALLAQIARVVGLSLQQGDSAVPELPKGLRRWGVAKSIEWLRSEDRQYVAAMFFAVEASRALPGPPVKPQRFLRAALLDPAYQVT